MENETSNYVYAYFALRGDGFDANNVTNILKISPSRAYSRGDHYGENQNRVRKTSIWIYSTNGHIESKVAEDHLEWLLDKIEPRFSELRPILDRDDVSVMITIVIQLFTREWGHELSPGVVKRISDLNTPVGYSFYNLS